MRLFFDTEFTGLQKDTTLISIGIVPECDDKFSFYAELTDFDQSQLDSWLNDHVVKNLFLGEKLGVWQQNEKKVTYYRGDKKGLKSALMNYMLQFDNIEMWSDCLSYDWVLFCDIFGSAFEIPKNIYYIPFDLCTLMKESGIDPDISRENFANVIDNDIQKHNALWDAKIIKECYSKIKYK